MKQKILKKTIVKAVLAGGAISLILASCSSGSADEASEGTASLNVDGSPTSLEVAPTATLETTDLLEDVTIERTPITKYDGVWALDRDNGTYLSVEKEHDGHVDFLNIAEGQETLNISLEIKDGRAVILEASTTLYPLEQTEDLGEIITQGLGEELQISAKFGKKEWVDETEDVEGAHIISGQMLTQVNGGAEVKSDYILYLSIDEGYENYLHVWFDIDMNLDFLTKREGYSNIAFLSFGAWLILQ